MVEKNTKSNSVELKPRRSRRSMQQGELHIPESIRLARPDVVFRWVADNASNVSKKLDLGYEPVSASQNANIASSVGDFTLSGGRNVEGDLIVKTGRLGTKHILMSIPRDLYEQYRQEHEEETLESESQMKRSSRKFEQQYQKVNESSPK